MSSSPCIISLIGVALAIKAENLQEYHDDFNGIQARMLEKVGHIAVVAGQTDEELARDLACAQETPIHFIPR